MNEAQKEKPQQHLTREQLIALLRDHAPVLKQQFHVSSIGLFGSYASGATHDMSDIDLVVSFDAPIGLRFVELADALESMLGRRVDLLTVEGIRQIRVASVRNNITSSVQHVWPS